MSFKPSTALTSFAIHFSKFSLMWCVSARFMHSKMYRQTSQGKPIQLVDFCNLNHKFHKKRDFFSFIHNRTAPKSESIIELHVLGSLPYFQIKYRTATQLNSFEYVFACRNKKVHTFCKCTKSYKAWILDARHFHIKIRQQIWNIHVLSIEHSTSLRQQQIICITKKFTRSSVIEYMFIFTKFIGREGCVGACIQRAYMDYVVHGNGKRETTFSFLLEQQRYNDESSCHAMLYGICIWIPQMDDDWRLCLSFNLIAWGLRMKMVVVNHTQKAKLKIFQLFVISHR